MKSRASAKDSEAGGIQAPPRKRRQLALATEQQHEHADTMQGADAGLELAMPMQMAGMAEFMVSGRRRIFATVAWCDATWSC